MAEYKAGLSYDDFVDLVADMRRAQQEYFAEKGPKRLRDAKVAEQLVDRVLKGIQRASQGQQQLPFGGNGTSSCEEHIVQPGNVQPPKAEPAKPQAPAPAADQPKPKHASKA